MEYTGKDNKSHMLKHMLQSGHPSVSPKDIYFKYFKKDITTTK